MADIRTLAPHDPLPEGRSIVLMRRFAEDEPGQDVIELIVRDADGAEANRIPTGADGSPLGWDDALREAERLADADGLPAIHVVDRLAGRPERSVREHGGDRSAPGQTLDDEDTEDGVSGSDMRDNLGRQAPRAF